MKQLVSGRCCAKSRVAMAIAAGLACSSAQAVQVLPIHNAVTIEQVDFRGGSNASVAEMTLNLSALSLVGGSVGYVNVADASGNWVVQNLPIKPDPGYDHPSITTQFGLNIPDGIDVTNGNFNIDYSPAPTLGFGGPGIDNFGIGFTTKAIGGFMGGLVGYLGSVAPSTVVFNPTGANSVVYQPRHPNVQAAHNQCAPMAVANSLQWLENEFGTPVPHNHVKGIKGDNSLVGKLDSAMDRAVTSRTNGSPIGAAPILEGKLEYVANNGLAGKVDTKHQGMLGGGDVSHHGQTSTAHGAAIDIDWIISELAAGENVEMGYLGANGGHFVDITGAGRILGIPWITYVSDHDQSDADVDNPGTPLVDETDTRGTGKVDFSFLNGNVMLNEAGQPSMAFVVSQSPIPEPAMLSLAVLGLLVRRRR